MSGPFSIAPRAQRAGSVSVRHSRCKGAHTQMLAYCFVHTGVVLGPRGSSELPRSMGGGPHVDATDNTEETRCLTRRIPAPVFVLTPACALRPDKGWAFAVNGPGPWYGLMQLHPHITRSTADATPHRGVHQTLNFVHLQIPVSGASREGGGARGRSKMHASRRFPQSGRET